MHDFIKTNLSGLTTAGKLLSIWILVSLPAGDLRSRIMPFLKNQILMKYILYFIGFFFLVSEIANVKGYECATVSLMLLLLYEVLYRSVPLFIFLSFLIYALQVFHVNDLFTNSLLVILVACAALTLYKQRMQMCNNQP